MANYSNNIEKSLYPLQSKYVKTDVDETETYHELPIRLGLVGNDNTTTKYLTLNDDNIIVFNTTSSAGNPFNQSLNTTDIPSFQSLFITASNVDNTENRILVLDDADNQVKVRDGTTIINQPTQTATFNIVSSNATQTGVLEISTVANDDTKLNLLTWDNVTNAVEYRTVASLPGGNPFDQSLNTTNAPTFTALTLNTLLDDLTPTRSVVSTASGVIGFKYSFHVTLERPIESAVGSAGLNNWSEILGNWTLGQSDTGELVTTFVPDGLIFSSSPQLCKLTAHVSFYTTVAAQELQFAFGQNPTISPVDPRSSYITAALVNQTYTTSISEYRILNTTGTGLWFKNTTSGSGILIKSCQIICENL